MTDQLSLELIFILKFLIVFCVSCKINRHYPSNFIASMCAGWMIYFIANTALIHFLSIYNLLETRYYQITLISVCSLFLYSFDISVFNLNRFLDLRVNASLNAVLIFSLIFLMAIRSLYLLDYTWDAQVYELSRLVIWKNAKTIFLVNHVPQINIFTNEWNAELTALSYSLLCDCYQGFSLGNYEIYLLLFLSVVFISSDLPPNFHPATIRVSAFNTPKGVD